MGVADPHGLMWRKSTRSGENGGNCVEVAAFSGVVGVRDSKNRSGPVLIFSCREWKVFLQEVKRSRAAGA
jgi:Domain of unknown function (DUF397).